MQEKVTLNTVQCATHSVLMRVRVIGDRAYGLNVWRRRLDNVRVHVGGAARVGGGARREHVQAAVVSPAAQDEMQIHTYTQTSAHVAGET